MFGNHQLQHVSLYPEEEGLEAQAPRCSACLQRHAGPMQDGRHDVVDYQNMSAGQRLNPRENGHHLC